MAPAQLEKYCFSCAVVILAMLEPLPAILDVLLAKSADVLFVRYLDVIFVRNLDVLLTSTGVLLVAMLALNPGTGIGGNEIQRSAARFRTTLSSLV